MLVLKNPIDRRVKQVDKCPYLPYKSVGWGVADKLLVLKDDNYLSVGMFGLPIDFYCRID